MKWLLFTSQEVLDVMDLEFSRNS